MELASTTSASQSPIALALSPRDRRVIFAAVIKPELEAFMRDRELSKERFDEIAAGALESVHSLHDLLPW